MKRILTSLVALWLILAGAGITIYQHYCHGEFAGSTVGVTQSVCAKCGMTDDELLKSKCCQTDMQFFQVKSDQLQSTWIPTITTAILNVPFSLEDQGKDISPPSLRPNAQAPPDSVRPIWMRLGVFLS